MKIQHEELQIIPTDGDAEGDRKQNVPDKK